MKVRIENYCAASSLARNKLAGFNRRKDGCATEGRGASHALDCVCHLTIVRWLRGLLDVHFITVCSLEFSNTLMNAGERLLYKRPRKSLDILIVGGRIASR